MCFLGIYTSLGGVNTVAALLSDLLLRHLIKIKYPPKMKNLSVSLVFLLMVLISVVQANNIAVTSVTLSGQNTSAGTNNRNNFTYVQFNLSWQNSWRTSASPSNWDAAWVFVKFRIVGQPNWQHAHLDTGGHIPGSGTGHRIQVGLENERRAFSDSNRAVGAFIYRSADSSGTFSASSIRLKWFYVRNGVQDADLVDVDVHGLEMVYVPAGSFWLGNNGINAPNTNEFYTFGATPSQGYLVNSNSFTAGYNSGNLAAGPQNSPAHTSGSFIDSFPTGFSGFYCMKYELSQQHFVNFLNSLNSTQAAANRYPFSPAPSVNTKNRYGLAFDGLTHSTVAGNLAMNYVTWRSGVAYLDWAGIRPMTEMEFEKACRGTVPAVTDEYAWGTTDLVRLAGYNNPLAINETPDSAGCNSNLGSFRPDSIRRGPMRVGACAGAATTRVRSGASFYGIMDLTGNLWEMTVGLFASSAPTTLIGGTQFTPLHGDGLLNAAGNATVRTWPSFVPSTGGVSDPSYNSIVLRGGSWATGPFSNPTVWVGTNGKPPHGRISFRPVMISTFNQPEEERQFGIRGVRSLPTSPVR